MPLRQEKPSFSLIPCVDRFAAFLKILTNHMIGGNEVSPDHEFFSPHKSTKPIVLFCIPGLLDYNKVCALCYYESPKPVLRLKDR